MLARSGPEQAAVVRTTRAVTRLRGSAGDNVLAERATAMVNVRIATGSTVEAAVDDIRAVVGDGIEVRLVYGSDPPPVSRAGRTGVGCPDPRRSRRCSPAPSPARSS